MLFKKKEKQILNYAQAKRYFEQIGSNIDSLGFPKMDLVFEPEEEFVLTLEPKEGYVPIEERYSVWFEDIETRPRVNKDETGVISKGVYYTQPCGSHRINGAWVPGRISKYDFEVKDNNLETKLANNSLF